MKWRILKSVREQNDAALRHILCRLKEGAVYGIIYNYRPDHPDRPKVKEGFWISLYKPYFRNLIAWDCFGSSACNFSLKDLNWTIRRMFGTTPREFLNDYCEKELAYKFIRRTLTKEEWKLFPKKALHLYWKY